jgi:predicted transcriptional regulator
MTAMEVHLKPDLKAKLDQWAAETGRPAGELVEEAMVGYFDELAQVRGMLDRRYDDLKSGRVRLIDGSEALTRLQAKSKARHPKRSG